MKNKLMGLLKEEQGQGMTEYGLVLGVIAVGIIAVLATFRTQILTMFTNLTTAISNAS